MTHSGQRALHVSRVAQGGLGLCAALWAGTLFLAPAALFPVGAAICHQRPERSFFIDGHQMAVCARCAGLYVGAALAVPLALIYGSALTTRRARAIATVAGLPTLLTWTLEFAHVADFSNGVRFAAALPLGFAAAWLMLGVLAPIADPRHPDP